MTRKIFLAVPLLFAVPFLAQEISHAEDRAVISYVQGEGMIMRNSLAIPAAVGIPCQKNDALKTGANCTLDLSMNNLVGCRVLASSRCLIAETNPNAMQVKIENGNAILNLEKLPKDSAFKVETPTAIAAVRGTQFWGRVDLNQPANPVTTFAVRQGSVEIFTKAAGLNLLIKQGQALDIPKDPAVVPSLRPALAEELAAMEQASSVKTSA